MSHQRLALPDITSQKRARHRTAVTVVAGLLTTLAFVGCGSTDDDATSSTSAGTTSASSAVPGEPVVLPTGPVRCGATKNGDDPCLIPAKVPEGKAVKIAFFGIAGVDYTVAVQKAVKKTAAENNAMVDVFLNPFDAAQEARQLQDAIAKDEYDAFIIEPVNPAALKPLMKQLVQKKKPFSTWVLTNGTDETTAKRQFDGQTFASTRTPSSAILDVVDGTLEACGDKSPCNVVHLRGVPSLPYDNAMTDIFNKEMAKHPNVKVVSTVDGEYSTAGAEKAMQDVLQVQKRVDVVASHSDGMTLGAERAVNAAGLKGVQYTSQGGGTYAVKAIREGRWFSSSVVLPTNEGIINTLAVIAAARGEKVGAGVATVDTRGSLPANLKRSNMSDWADFAGQYLGI